MKTNNAGAPAGDQNDHDDETTPKDPPAGDKGKKPEDPAPEPDEGDEDEVPEDEDKGKGKKPTLAELLKSDPSLAAQHGKALASQRKQLEAEIRKRLEVEAAETAKRAQMAEVDRLKAELKDKEDANAKLAQELRATALDRDLAQVLVESEVRLQEGALDILRDKVLAATKDEDEPDYPAAVEEVLKKYPWLRAGRAARESEEQEPKEPREPKEQAKKPDAPRLPGKKGNAQPAKPEPQKSVDVFKMSPQEYAKHRKEKGLQ